MRLIEEDGRYAWISKLYTPLPEEDCPAPELECVVDYGKLGTPVYTNSTGPEHVGHVSNAIVKVLGPRQDGRVRVDMADPGGPIGWIRRSSVHR